VLLCQGTGAGGFSFYIKDGKLQYVHNYVSRKYFQVVSVESVPEGRHQLRFEFQPTGKPDIPKGQGTPGRGQLYIDGKLVGAADFPVTTPIAFNPGGLTCGVLLQKILQHESEECLCGMRGISSRKRRIFSLFYKKSM
jgi:hypothetical protein